MNRRQSRFMLKVVLAAEALTLGACLVAPGSAPSAVLMWLLLNAIVVGSWVVSGYIAKKMGEMESK